MKTGNPQIDVENESDKQKLRSATDVLEAHGLAYSVQHVSRETLLMRKHPDQYRDLVVRVQATPPSSPRCRRMRRTISSPVPNICCICPAPSRTCPELPDGARLTGLRRPVNQKAIGAVKHGLNDVERLTVTSV